MSDETTAEQLTFVNLCVKALKDRGWDQYEEYKDRLKLEIKEINAQAEHEYFLSLMGKKKFPVNDNNLLVAVLLGLCDRVDMSSPPEYVQGEFPDIDMDYPKEIQDYLRLEWAPNKYGKDKVCLISTYGKMGIKSAALDMTRVHGIPRDEIQAITKTIEDKDDEGEDITWEKANEIYPALKDYCTRFPEVADATKNLIHRRKSSGVHAGGLIISSKPIADFVPLEVRSVDKENKYGVIVSAWSEGQATQDLQPVGLVKFDVLVVDGLKQIAYTCEMIKERYGIDSISALPGNRNWSDISYLNDPKAIEMANKGDLKCIFQFGSEGIRKLVKKGGVNSFDDLAAYSALYRPGPLGMKMDERFCNRKRRLEKYDLHPIMQSILGYTYGVMVFQEQVMQILNRVGGIPLIHCEKIRKAISKKKIDQFIKYKEMFLRNGQRILGVSEKEIQNLWDQVEAFSDYGFNKSHSYAYTMISARQLYLKAHYPLEYYTAVLQCETDTDKLKEIKLDAAQHGINVMPIHINKSKVNFSILDIEEDKRKGHIYYGFKNLKHIGQIAEVVVSGQPYESFVDFLDRFGTDNTVLKALISLGIFEEKYDRVTLYKFYEYYKNHTKKGQGRDKRFVDSLENHQKELEELLTTTDLSPELQKELAVFDNEEIYDKWTELCYNMEREETFRYKGDVRTRTVTVAKLLHDIRKKRESCVRVNKEKVKYSNEQPPSIETFNPSKIKLDEETAELIGTDTKQAERKYYGYQWVHELEECIGYKGHTIDHFLQEAEVNGNIIGAIEVKVIEVRKKDFKSGNGFAYDVKVEDANGKEVTVRFWKDDFDRFRDDLVAGTLMRMRVRPPVGNFPSFNFYSPPRHERYKLAKTREDDVRIYLLKKDPAKATNVVDLTEESFDVIQ